DSSSGKDIPGPWNDRTDGFGFVAISPDGALLATIGTKIEQRAQGQVAIQDRLIKLWDPAKSKPLQVIDVEAGRLLAIAFMDGGKTLVSACATVVQWWDVATGIEKRSWKLDIQD